MIIIIGLKYTYKDDNKAFIFTLKNLHGVEPTRFMKRKESNNAIYCNYSCGPMFGDSDIYIRENCNSGNNSSTNNDGTKGYECHPQYKKLLFVNTDGPDNRNAFNVLDYEVFTH